MAPPVPSDARRRPRSAARPRSDAIASPGPSYRWTRWIAYALLLFFAAYWGAKIFTEHRIGNYFVETDFYWKYGPAARDLLHGRVAIENYDSKGWGYPVAVALLSLFGLDPFRAAQVLANRLGIGIGFPQKVGDVFRNRLCSSLQGYPTGFFEIFGKVFSIRDCSSMSILLTFDWSPTCGVH